jgi:hypothetical protein
MKQMKHYIIHNDKEVERKKLLEAQLEKFGIQDVEWVTTFPKEDLEYLKRINSYTPLGHLSCNMKHYDAMNRMVTEGIKEAIVFEDDVILSDLYDETKIPREYSYIKLGRGPPDSLLEPSQEPRIVHNNGGNEAYFVSLNFAKKFQKSLMWTMDIEQQAFLVHIGAPIVCVPMCFQKYETSIHESRDSEISWIDFIHRYPSYKKYTFEELKDGAQRVFDFQPK